MAAPPTPFTLPEDEEAPLEGVPESLRAAVGLPPVPEEPARREIPDEPELTEEQEAQQSAAENLDHDELLQILWNYLNVAREARESGMSDRETQWRQNYDAYWVRYNTEEKEEWQATESIPEVQNAVDRLTASLRQALIQGQWYTIEDPGDPDHKLDQHIRKFMDVLLDRCGRDATEGHVLGFEHVFADIVKSGLLTMCAAQVRVDEFGHPIVECLDARENYLDPTLRNLYRIRQYETDWHTLNAEAQNAPPEAGWHKDRVESLRTAGGEDTEGRQDKERSSGTTYTGSDGNRRPVMLHEYRCDLVSEEGELIAENQLIVMGDERQVVRGPIRNPFWHGRDWTVAAPVIQIPFSVYGRSWVEGFRSLVDTFISYTNLILDASFIESLKAFQVWPDALEDASQGDSVHPGATYLANEETPLGQPFVVPIDMGRLSSSVVVVWQAIQQLVREATSQNELSLGQLPPQGDTTATAVVAAERGQSQLVRSMARDLEQRVIGPILDLLWSVGLQFLDPDDEQMRQDLGAETFDMMVQQKAEFRERRIRFKAHGISATLERADRVRAKLAVVQTISNNEFLLQLFRQNYSFQRLMESIFADMGLNLLELSLTEPERAQQQAAELAARESRRSGARPSGGGGLGVGAVGGGNDTNA